MTGNEAKRIAQAEGVSVAELARAAESAENQHAAREAARSAASASASAGHLLAVAAPHASLALGLG